MDPGSDSEAAASRADPSTARNVFLNLVGLSLPLVAAVITIPTVIDRLGVQRFGILSLGWTVIISLGILDLGLGRAVTRFSAHALHRGEAGRVGEYLWSAIGFQAIVGSVVGLVLAGVTPALVTRIFNMPSNLEDEARAVFYILAISVPILMISASLRGMLEAMHRFDLVNAIRAPFTAANFLVPFAAVFAGAQLSMIAWLLLGAQATALLLYLWACLRVLPPVARKPRFRGSQFRLLLSFGGWVTVSSIVGPLLVYSDRFVVGAVLSVGAVTYYATPYEMVTRLWFIPVAVVTALFPLFSTHDAGGGHGVGAGRLMARGMKAILLPLGVVVVTLIGAANEILEVWLGPAFVQRSTAVLQILAVGVLLNSLAQVPYGLLQGAGRPDIPARLHLVELPVHIVLVWWLVATWGLVGAAIAWTFRVVIDGLLLLVATRRLGLLDPIDLINQGLAASGFILGFALGAVIMLDVVDAGLVFESIGLALIISLTVAALWRRGMDDADRSRVRTGLAQLHRRAVP